MGNSARKTFGNLCGAEGSKERPDEDVKPVPKPKEEPLKNGKNSPFKEKKKNKKNKKNKKKEEGSANEENDVKTDDILNNSKLESAGENVESERKTLSSPPTSVEDNTKQDEDEDLVSGHESTLKDQAASSSNILDYNKNEKNVNKILEEEEEEEEEEDEEMTSEDEGGESDDHEPVNPQFHIRYEPSSPSFTDGPSPTCSSFSNLLVEKGSSSSENDQNIFTQAQSPYYLQVHYIKPEELSINCVDEIFKECSEKYQDFVDAIDRFKDSVTRFMETPSFKDCKQNIFFCFEVYKEMLASTNEVDLSDLNVAVQFIKVEGQEVIESVGDVRPSVQISLKDAADVDVIEYVKEKMTEGVQLGITSKFSAPGKYRRNMKLLRSALKELGIVEAEVKEILKALSDIRSDSSVVNEEGDETVIVPTLKPMECDIVFDDWFSKLDNLEQSTSTNGSSRGVNVIKENNVVTNERKLLSSESQLKPTLLEQSIEAGRKTENGESKEKLHEIPEIKPRDIKHELKEPAKTSNSQILTIEETEHNTLDFGNYILVDPNTSDIQVMRNRSRSLDSLASIKSNRSSISRFGSFEFVTEFEITIAEKNQQLLN